MLKAIIEKMKNSCIWKIANDYNSIAFRKWLDKEFICDLEKASALEEEMAKALMDNNSLFDVLYDNEELFDKEISTLYRKNKNILEKYYGRNWKK